MTEAEKLAAAEAAKAQAAKEAELAAAGKEAENDDDKEEDEPSDPKAHIAKLNAENAKRRQNEKALKAQVADLTAHKERQNKALEILTGKKVGDVDPLEKAKAESDLRQARLLIRAELATVARDAHNPAMLFKAFPEKFKDVRVDLELESVDSDQLKEAVDSIRKENPFLFAKKGEQKNEPTKAPFTNPDNGSGGGGGNHFATWQGFKQAGNSKQAQEYYNKNKTLILAQMSSKT